MNDPKHSGRYPYTYAYDNLRLHAHSPETSRAACAAMMEKICEVMKLDKPTVCTALADNFIEEGKA